MAGVDFSQVHRLFGGLVSAAEQAEADLRAVAHRHARRVHASAQARLPARGSTPHATGATRAALQVVENREKKLFRVEVGDIPGRDPMVPVYLEFGTVGTPAQPFLRPAVDEHRGAYLKDAEAAVLARLNRV